MAIALQSWADALEAGRAELPKYLVHPLEHQYTPASLGLSALKSSDRTRVDCLRGVAKESGTELFLATMEREVFKDDDGYSDSSGGSIIDTTVTLTNVLRLDGTAIGNDFPVPETNVLRMDDLNDNDHEDSDHSGYAGNEGCTATYWYNDAVRYLSRNHLVQ
jgi:hypothetical protein